MTFELHPKLANKALITDLPLCRVLLQDEKNYTWIFLVPRRADICRMIDLDPKDQLQLMREMDFAQKIIWNNFHPAQLNVAALGNKIPQLHIHIIGRNEGDPAWPQTVWDHPTRVPYSPEEKEKVLALFKTSFNIFNH